MVFSTARVGHRAKVTPRKIQQVGRLYMPARARNEPFESLGRVAEAFQPPLRADSRSNLAHVARVVSLGGFAASIVHEIGQPLTAINLNTSTCLRMLNADPPDIDGARETARFIARDGKRASDVVTSLRALFSRAEPVTELVNLNAAAQKVVSLLPTEFQRSVVHLQMELQDPLPPVRGDCAQLQQVMLNLILNALDAMQGVEGRRRLLTVRTDQDEDRVRFSVQDVGAGIGHHNVNRLFEPFFTTKVDGMGIGLAISRSIVESHGGRICAAPNDGPGSTFSFFIPIAAGARDATACTDDHSLPARNREPSRPPTVCT